MTDSRINKSVKPSIPDVLPKFINYYDKPENGAWGNLHIVLDDGNIDDHFVISCREWAQECDDIDGVELANILLKMSKSQRIRLPNKVWEAIRDRRNG